MSAILLPQSLLDLASGSLSHSVCRVFLPVMMPPPSYTYLDTTGLDSIEIVAANSEAPLVPDKVTYSGGKLSISFCARRCSRTRLLRADCASAPSPCKHLENAISIFTNNTATGIEYIPASITLKQTQSGGIWLPARFCV